ncbi:MAG: hypothetical protein Q8P48_04270 [Deltaproteobacteria bacterium]|nr:hypothetical protein [Deltaproteobacteria bacterium]
MAQKGQIIHSGCLVFPQAWHDPVMNAEQWGQQSVPGGTDFRHEGQTPALLSSSLER